MSTGLPPRPSRWRCSSCCVCRCCSQRLIARVQADDDAAVRRRLLASRLALGFAFLYLPIALLVALFVQRLAAGDGLGRVLDALVRRAARQRAHPRGGGAAASRIAAVSGDAWRWCSAPAPGSRCTGSGGSAAGRCSASC